MRTCVDALFATFPKEVVVDATLVQANLERLMSSFLPEYSQFVSSFSSYFIQSIPLCSKMSEQERFASAVFASGLSRDQRVQIGIYLANCITEIEEKFFSVLDLTMKLSVPSSNHSLS